MHPGLLGRFRQQRVRQQKAINPEPPSSPRSEAWPGPGTQRGFSQPAQTGRNCSSLGSWPQDADPVSQQQYTQFHYRFKRFEQLPGETGLAGPPTRK